MTKQNAWVCAEGCDVSKSICRHIERTLPQMGDGRLCRANDVNLSVDVIRVNHPQFDLKEFQQLMRDYGFYEEWDLDLLTAKYFYGQSLRQIAEDFNWCSFSTIRWRLKELHVLLQERGFKQENL